MKQNLEGFPSQNNFLLIFYDIQHKFQIDKVSLSWQLESMRNKHQKKLQTLHGTFDHVLVHIDKEYFFDS